MDKTPQTSTQPEAKFKSGAVVASIWKNEGQNGPYRTVTLTRSYKDRDENWQRTKPSAENMPDVATVPDGTEKRGVGLRAGNDRHGPHRRRLLRRRRPGRKPKLRDSESRRPSGRRRPDEASCPGGD